MAVEYMTAVDPYNTRNDWVGWEYDSGEVASPGNGNWIIIPDNVKGLSCTLYISSGEGNVETTDNKLADIISGTGIIAVEWASGSVTSTIQDGIDSNMPRAIRMVNISGTTRLLITAQ